MMNTINKIDTFELSQKHKTSKEDEENLEKMQSIYENTLLAYKKWYDIYHETVKSISEHNYYSLKLKDFSISEKIKTLNNDFISEIYNYFSSKYKIYLDMNFKNDLNSNDNDKDYIINKEPLNYKKYTNEILKQLGDLSFKEIRIKQLKEKIKNVCKNTYKNEWKVKIQGDTIKFNDLVSWYKYNWENDYKLVDIESFLLIESALSFFEYGKEIKFKEFAPIRFVYGTKWDSIEKNIKINSKKIKSLKLFKNGRVDIKFCSSETAKEFIENWCGYKHNDAI